MSITEIAVRRPLLILVIFTVLILFGVQCYLKLNYNLLPKIEVATVSVSTVYPGASPAEVESAVTRKLEDAFASIEGLDQISSTSQQGISQITVQLRSNADVDEAERNLQRKADQTQNELPDGVDKPLVNKVNLEETPVIRAGATSKQSGKTLYDLMDKQIKPILQNLPGVGQVNIIGGEKREIQVNVDQKKMEAYGLSIAAVTAAVKNANQSFPAGIIETKARELSIQYDARVNSVAQIRSLIVRKGPELGNVTLGDIAEVVDGTATPTALNHVNGLPSVGIQIIKQSDANAVKVSKGVRATLSRLEMQYQAQDLKFIISTDQSTYTLHSANGVLDDLILAIVIVALVMLAFLHSVRSSLFVLVALPSSIIPTFIAMYLLGFSLNLMSLMALSLVVGILVDDSIVVLENIYRHLEMGSDRKKAALDGRNEIGFTALAITLVDVVVFLPLSFAGGVIGTILKEFSLVVVVSTLMSLFVSFTITPMLASRFGKIEQLNSTNLWGKTNRAFERLLANLTTGYAEMLRWILKKKRWLLSVVILLIIGSIMLVAKGFIGASFIPAGDQGEVLMNLELPAAASLYQTNLVTQKAEKIILSAPEVDKVFSSVGFVSGSVSGTSNTNNQTELTVTLKDLKFRSKSSEEFGIDMQAALTAALPGVKVSASPTSLSGAGNQAPIQIAIKGTNLDTIRRLAEQYETLMAMVPGTKFVKLSVKERKEQIEVKLDREKMTTFGLKAGNVGRSLQNAFSGDNDSKFKQSGNEFDILIALDKADRSDMADIGNLRFSDDDGQTVMLGQFAQLSKGLGETVLQRTDRLNSITVLSNVAGRPTGTVAADIRGALDKIKIPGGVTIEYLGDVKNQDDAFGSLGIALITAILLVYLIMVALYESLIYPFVVLFSIPVALVGALLALALTMETLNIFSIIGIIMLLGLVSKNAILIVDFARQLHQNGRPVEEALIEAGTERLRPILMTTLAMILGMLPIALATGAGSEIKNGMAWVIIGGLTSSMILTLFVVPSMYLILDKLKSQFRRQPLAAHPVPA